MRIRASNWLEIITSREAKSGCFQGPQTSCTEIISGVFLAKIWPKKITSRDGCVLLIHGRGHGANYIQRAAEKLREWVNPPLPHLGEAKPGGFQTGGFPTLFGKGPDCVADPFGTVPRRRC